MKPVLRKCLVATAFASALIAASCQKETESPTTMTLAVNDNTINLEAKSGKEHVLVYAKGQWNAEFKEAVEWAAIEEGSGKGNGEFILTYKKNPDILRRAEILITAAGVDKTITVTVNQEGEKGTPKLAFAENEKAYIAWEVKDAIAVESNIDQSLIKAESSAEWIGGLELKDGQLSFTVAENTTGEQRKGTLTVSYTDIDEAVYRAVAEITQGSEPGHLTLKETEMAIEAFAGTKTVQWDCALGTFMPELVSSVTYEGSQKDWIGNVTPSVESLSFDVTDNETKEARTAVIKVELASKGIAVNLKVTQGVKTKQYSFEELRAVLSAAGEQAFEGDWFEGVVIADAGKENMETNTMTSIPFTDEESRITNYVQSLDGKYGMRLKFATAAGNTLKKGDKVKISLAGATLVREDNPVRYTLRKLTANNVTVEETVSLSPRQKAISELSDDDVYTLVTLPDVEVPFCYGSWVNVRKEWIADKRINFDNRILRDVNGGEIRMIVNTDVPWYMTTAGVPKGSGPVSGVIVSTESPYYGADILGKYQIRPMELADIEIKDDGFSKILVDWDYKAGFTKGTSLAATTGTGTMKTVSNMVQTSSQMQFGDVSSFPKKDPKAINVNDGTWWKDGAAKDDVRFQFSALEAAGKKMHLSFGAFVGTNQEDATSQAPVHWSVEYSLDGGTSFTTVETVMIRPMGAKASKLLFVPASIDDQCVELPDEIAGKDNVIIRFIAADAATVNWSTKDYSETVADGGKFRLVFGALAVKYNK